MAGPGRHKGHKVAQVPMSPMRDNIADGSAMMVSNDANLDFLISRHPSCAGILPLVIVGKVGNDGKDR
jgi:hypothetical protein